jgi:hypothetical protein
MLCYPKADLRGIQQMRWWGYPGFPVQFGGSGALLAAFLKESRMRGRVQCSVQEIRDAPSFSAQVRFGEPGAPVLFLWGSAMTQTPTGLNFQR